MMANTLRLTRLAAIGLTLAASLAALPAHGQTQQRPVSLRNSFPVGSNGLCEAQIQAPAEGDGLFDRRYSIICRDASAPVGMLHVVRATGEDIQAERFAPSDATCDPQPGAADAYAIVPDARVLRCASGASGISRDLVIGRQGNRAYAATGLTVYRDALKLGLASLAQDRVVEGEVDIPLTEATDSQAFARAQAEAISGDAALTEAYRRSNAGKFAEAAEFFAASADVLGGSGGTEAQLNAALQQSNLGNHLEAARLFWSAEQSAAGNIVLARMLRNYQAIDALNQNNPAEAIAILDRPLPGADGSEDALRSLIIDSALATRLTAEGGSVLGGQGTSLTPLERAQLLDGQGAYIRAAALRLTGQQAEARVALETARAQLAEVRGGRISSILWLRAQTLGELAEIEERAGNASAAEALHAEAISLLEFNYPGAPILQSARAQLAGFYARTGRADEAIEVYRELVEADDSRPAASLRKLLAPYFRLLTERGSGADVANDLFSASQLMARPGLAQTQAILARELSGGSDEASQLFRRALNLQRSVEKVRAQIVEMEVRATDQPQLAEALAEKRAQLARLSEQQLATQQKLAEYPRFRVVSDDRMTLANLQEILRPGEAYVKLIMLENRGYALFADGESASAWQIDGRPEEIEYIVDTIRETIAVEEAGQTITYPFDIEASRDLFTRLMGPVEARLATVNHLVFDPDGALLRLPANLLVMDQDSVDRYNARFDADPDADPYDFRGTKWLGKEMVVTTAVSPTSFRDVRAAPASDAARNYIGFGQNVPIGETLLAAGGVRSGGAMDDQCAWSPATWNDPIAKDELITASSILGSQSGTALLTGAEFTDTAVRNRPDLNEYRIMHFATHGLVTAPRPQCPPRPALLTSFGDTNSDGLLTFAEVFDLKIDADLVILSACNTAGQAGTSATNEAGLTTGGDFALDGLVRAFVGAGGRTVVASHWPVPDDFDATQRLVTGLFETQPGVTVAQAMRDSQLGLMEDADTSHPFYWSAFAIVGDGNVAIRRD